MVVVFQSFWVSSDYWYILFVKVQRNWGVVMVVQMSQDGWESVSSES